MGTIPYPACAVTAPLTLRGRCGAVQRGRQGLNLLADDPFGGLATERAHIDLATAGGAPVLPMGSRACSSASKARTRHGPQSPGMSCRALRKRECRSTNNR
jgi:hypothetical protein